MGLQLSPSQQKEGPKNCLPCIEKKKGIKRTTTPKSLLSRKWELVLACRKYSALSRSGPTREDFQIFKVIR